MISKALAESWLDKGMRLDTIIHLGTMLNAGVPPIIVADSFYSGYDRIMEQLGLKADDYDPDDMECLAEALYDKGKLGFLVEVATPVPDYSSSTSFSTQSWGYYSTQWVYAESFVEALDKCEQWYTAYHADKKKEAGHAE